MGARFLYFGLKGLHLSKDVSIRIGILCCHYIFALENSTNFITVVDEHILVKSTGYVMDNYVMYVMCNPIYHFKVLKLNLQTDQQIYKDSIEKLSALQNSWPLS